LKQEVGDGREKDGADQGHVFVFKGDIAEGFFVEESGIENSCVFK
jgi:hypothetical protein